MGIEKDDRIFPWLETTQVFGFLIKIEGSRSCFLRAHLCPLCLIYNSPPPLFPVLYLCCKFFIPIKPSSNIFCTMFTIVLLPECRFFNWFICAHCSISQIPGVKSSGCLMWNRQRNFIWMHVWTFYLNNEGVRRSHVSSIRLNTNDIFQWSVQCNASVFSFG